MKKLTIIAVMLLTLPLVAFAEKRIHNKSGMKLNVTAEYYGESVWSCRKDQIPNLPNDAIAHLQPGACIFSKIQVEAMDGGKGPENKAPLGDDLYILPNGSVVNQDTYNALEATKQAGTKK